MKLSSLTLLAVVLTGFGCSDSDEPLEGWKESDVEVVTEGAATGTTGQIVAGESATPMTATDIDTTTDLDMITDEQLGLENGGVTRQDERSLADTLDPGSSARESTELETTPRGPGVAARPAPPVTRDPEPAPSPSPAPAREPGPSGTDTTDEAVDSPPPIVTPPLEPEPPAEEENEPAPPPTETTRTDTTDSSGRDEDPPRSGEPDDEPEQRDEGDRR